MTDDPLPEDLQAVFDAAVACLDAAEQVLNLNSPERRQALSDQVEALDKALEPVGRTLPDAGLTVAVSWHSLVLKQARKVLRAAEIHNLARGKVIAFRWDIFFPVRPIELATELEREVRAAAPKAASACVDLENYSEENSGTKFARLFRINYKTFLKRVKSGEIRAIRVSRNRWRVHLDDLPRKPSAC